jgi:hypothetical protein
MAFSNEENYYWVWPLELRLSAEKQEREVTDQVAQLIYEHGTPSEKYAEDVVRATRARRMTWFDEGMTGYRVWQTARTH